MTISANQVKLLHVAKGKLGIGDDDYRRALAHLARVTTSKDLDREGFETMMGFFEWMGFKPLGGRGPSYGQRPGMASFAQIELIRALWSEYTDGVYEGEDQLNKWLERCFKVSSLRFLKADAAPKVITALKSMKARKAA
ncbi:MAG: regulatory protein GemA [Albidovulum sp.]|uniref:regulatory protein GemA n=1 Tax=Albidovulum sp. TaxID=1872424 RepID=UPI003CB34270